MDESYKKKLDGFLKSHNFGYDGVYAFYFQKHLEDMFRVYDRSKNIPGSMIDTRIGKPEKIPTDQDVLVVDVGGTNVRRSIVTFNALGHPFVSHMKKVAFKDLLEGKDFFKSLASFITPMLRRSNISNIAICFSFPFIPTDDGDAIVSGSAKGLEREQFKDKKILASLKKEINKTMHRKLNMSIVNDATSLLLYLALVEKDTNSLLIASIVGTGTNCAVYHNPNFYYGGKYTAICTEIGHFNMEKFELSDFDYEVDKESEHPGSSLVEILTSGFYLHKVFRKMIEAAINENVFNEEDMKEAKQYADTINDTKDIDRVFTLTEGIKYLADKFVERSSYTVKAILNASCNYAGNFGLHEKASVIVEGSTYYLLPGYKENTEARIKEDFHCKDVKLYYPVDNKGTVVLYGAALSTFCKRVREM